MDHISIHALREEGDIGLYGEISRQTDFYPRPPRGGRRNLQNQIDELKAISIHALREEGDARW